jgi:hypothetical protein
MQLPQVRAAARVRLPRRGLVDRADVLARLAAVRRGVLLHHIQQSAMQHCPMQQCKTHRSAYAVERHFNAVAAPRCTAHCVARRRMHSGLQRAIALPTFYFRHTCCCRSCMLHVACYAACCLLHAALGRVQPFQGANVHRVREQHHHPPLLLLPPSEGRRQRL